MDALRQRLKPELWQFLAVAAAEAEQRGWHLYLVGGAVRDLLLAIAAGSSSDNSTDALLLEDIDLVVDGFHQAADVGAGVAMARSLQTRYPTARLEVHGKFQTAALLWHHDPTLQSLWVDLATARTEFYPYPAANPDVEASSIRQDLYRRDFTINAMAICLTAPQAGELLDFFGGTLDLQAKQIRVLHANSFIEDPTRIYRAVRFAVRLGFQLDAQTEAYIRYAIASGIYVQIQDRQTQSRQTQHKPQPSVTAPALQTRLKAELKYILQAPYWQPALQQLAALGALQCIHPTLQIDTALWRQLRLVDRWLQGQKGVGNGEWGVGEAGAAEEAGGMGETDRRQEAGGRIQNSLAKRRVKSPTYKKHEVAPSELALLPTPHSLLPTPHPWLVLLEVLLAHLAPEYRATVAETLQLPTESIDRLRQLETAQTALMAALPTCQRPSQIVQLLKPYDALLLALIVVRIGDGRSPQQPPQADSPRRKIWHYLTHWLSIKPPLDGNDLKALGYQPGPQFKAILDALAAATVDGMVHTRAEAEAFVAKHFAHVRGEE